MADDGAHERSDMGPPTLRTVLSGLCYPRAFARGVACSFRTCVFVWGDVARREALGKVIAIANFSLALGLIAFSRSHSLYPARREMPVRANRHRFGEKRLGKVRSVAGKVELSVNH